LFRGVNPLTLDAKGRIAIPARYREELINSCNGRVVVTLGWQCCLLLYPLPQWIDVERKLNNLPSLDEQSESLKHLLMGFANDRELDGQSRILVPPVLRAKVGLTKQVVLVGQGNKFEIWDGQTWEANCERWLVAINNRENDLSSELVSLSL
jgi:mraZ protein